MRSEDDWQQQLDEFVALAAILDKDFTLTAGPGVTGDAEQDLTSLTLAQPCSERLQCTATVRITLPSGTITIKDGSTDGSKGSGFPVQHLPPILLHLSLPSAYPSAQPPGVQLNAVWASCQQLQQLREQLLNMWQEEAGSPICYTWVDWLQQNALAHLGLSDNFVLSDTPSVDPVQNTTQPAHSSDQNLEHLSQSAVSSNENLEHVSHPQQSSDQSFRQLPQPAQSTDRLRDNSISQHSAEPQPEPHGNQQQHNSSQELAAEQIIMHILRYDAAEKYHAFQQGSWSCGICFEEYPGKECVQASLQCGHTYCRDCMGQHCGLHVKEGTLEHLRCPQPDCKEPLDRQMVGSVLSDEQKARLEAVELERTLNLMMDAVYCPRCSTISIEDEDNCAQCSKCFYAFCSLCNESWHPGTKCLDAESKLELMRQRMMGTKSGEREFRKREAELQNLAHIQKNCKQCPSCGMAIERSEGCNHMICTSCGGHFCYKCNQQIEGYKHYWNNNCILFDLDEIERWEAMMGHRMEGVREEQQQDAQPAVRPEMACRCPRCGRINYKEGNNNNIKCPCKANFCYLCMELLIGRGASGRHFGPNRCKQHSE